MAFRGPRQKYPCRRIRYIADLPDLHERWDAGGYEGREPTSWGWTRSPSAPQATSARDRCRCYRGRWTQLGFAGLPWASNGNAYRNTVHGPSSHMTELCAIQDSVFAMSPTTSEPPRALSPQPPMKEVPSRTATWLSLRGQDRIAYLLTTPAVGGLPRGCSTWRAGRSWLKKDSTQPPTVGPGVAQMAVTTAPYRAGREDRSRLAKPSTAHAASQDGIALSTLPGRPGTDAMLPAGGIIDTGRRTTPPGRSK